jgi:hypothetical protein
MCGLSRVEILVCERALTVANNVAIDVTACVGPPGAAISVAHQIAAKVR